MMTSNCSRVALGRSLTRLELKSIFFSRPTRNTSHISMSLKTGIVGLPNVGKSTLFNALVENSVAQASNFPFCTIEPNFGIVNVPDDRLDVLANISETEKIVPATVEFVDIAGLVKGAADGQGLGNKFLSNIRECDALVHVVRCFEDTDIIHVDGSVDSQRDIAVINFELILSDLSQVERALERTLKTRGKISNAASKIQLYEKLIKVLESGRAVRTLDLSEEENSDLSDLKLLTMKPCIYAANVNEGDLRDEGSKNDQVQKLRETANEESAGVIVVSAQVEAEIMQLDKNERSMFLSDLGLSRSGLESLIRATYAQLGLQTYFTTGKKETRAWTIKRGFTAPQAAGVIHSDFERGFIK
mmetsp:Transcript_420/g.1640  ORF Transcript_420/g.1640 Transcript_420/m.1640 type:complete len:359 (-) Transcript_420:2840-3916(-)